MDDIEIVRQVDELVEREHALQRGHSDNELSEEERKQLNSIETQLDQCWDLLRRRRARRNAGLDPSEAQVRDVNVVEGYQQ
jgi:uncharacterized protein YjaG (DUF416 family)